jgi:peroxiredoxin
MAADPYNFDTYRHDINDPVRDAFHLGPARVGQPAPTFEMPLVGGGTITLPALLASGHAVLIFGCFSAPPCLWQLPAVEALHRVYGGRGFPFLFVYVREIHPGENFPPHRSIEQKLTQAEKLRDYARLTFPVASDDVEGRIHRSYGGMPSMSAVVRRDGTLIYRGAWTQADAIQMVLEDLLRFDRIESAGDPASLRASGKGRLAYHEWLSFMEREPQEAWDTVDLAGPKARADLDAAMAAR